MIRNNIIEVAIFISNYYQNRKLEITLKEIMNPLKIYKKLLKII